MHKAQQQVHAFHEKFGLLIRPTPSLLPLNLKDLFYGNVLEEDLELEKAIDDRDMIETIDAIVDLLYVTYGMAAVCGIDIEPFFDIVHRSNMRKSGGGKNAIGKPQKPKDWVPPTDDIIEELKRQLCVE